MYPCINPSICGVQNHRSADACKANRLAINGPEVSVMGRDLMSPSSTQDDPTPHSEFPRLHTPSKSDLNRYPTKHGDRLDLNGYPTEYGDDSYIPVGAYANTLDADEIESRGFTNLQIDDENYFSVDFANIDHPDEKIRRIEVSSKRNRLYVDIVDPETSESISDSGGIDVNDLDELEQWFDGFYADSFAFKEDD